MTAIESNIQFRMICVHENEWELLLFYPLGRYDRTYNRRHSEKFRRKEESRLRKRDVAVFDLSAV